MYVADSLNGFETALYEFQWERVLSEVACTFISGPEAVKVVFRWSDFRRKGKLWNAVKTLNITPKESAEKSNKRLLKI